MRRSARSAVASAFPVPGSRVAGNGGTRLSVSVVPSHPRTGFRSSASVTGGAAGGSGAGARTPVGAGAGTRRRGGSLYDARPGGAARACRSEHVGFGLWCRRLPVSGAMGFPARAKSSVGGACGRKAEEDVDA